MEPPGVEAFFPHPNPSRVWGPRHIHVPWILKSPALSEYSAHTLMAATRGLTQRTPQRLGYLLWPLLVCLDRASSCQYSSPPMEPIPQPGHFKQETSSGSLAIVSSGAFTFPRWLRLWMAKQGHGLGAPGCLSRLLPAPLLLLILP